MESPFEQLSNYLSDYDILVQKKVKSKKISKGIENVVCLRALLSFMFPPDQEPKERNLKLFLSYLMQNQTRENDTIRLLVLSFIQDKMNVVSAKTKNYYKFLTVNPMDSIPGLIVPVKEADTKSHYDNIKLFLEDESSNTFGDLHNIVDFSSPKGFFYTCVVFTNKAIEMHFRKINAINEKIKQQMNQIIQCTHLTQNQRNFLLQIQNGFSTSPTLNLNNMENIAVGFKLYVISVLSIFHSIRDPKNFLFQIGQQLKSNNITAIFLNVSNMFEIGERGKIEVTKLWKCRQCGYIFGLGNCGRPYYVYDCRCGAKIGGKNHVATPDTIELTPEEEKNYINSGDRYKIHEYLRDAYKTYLDIHPLCFRFLHSFIHALYLGFIETNYVNSNTLYSSLLAKLDSDFQHLKVTDKRDYFKKHIQCDFEVLQKMRNKNYLEYDLLTSLVVQMSDMFLGFTNQQQQFEAYNGIARHIGNQFTSLISGGTSLSIESKIKKFIQTSTKGLVNPEKEIILRNVSFSKVEGIELNKFLYYHLRNTGLPSLNGLMEYMRNNKELSERHPFILFYNEYMTLLDQNFSTVFIDLKEMCDFMNARLQNEFKKADMENLKVVDFIKKIGSPLNTSNF